MKTKSIATVLVLSAIAVVGMNPVLAQSPGGRGPGFNGGGGNFQGPGPGGRGFHRHGHHRGGGQIFVGDDDYGVIDAYSGEWYGITPGYDQCPRFRQRVMTPDGERIRMTPVC